MHLQMHMNRMQSSHCKLRTLIELHKEITVKRMRRTKKFKDTCRVDLFIFPLLSSFV